MLSDQLGIRPHIKSDVFLHRNDRPFDEGNDISKTQWTSGGFRVTGTPPCLINQPRKQISVSIACFVDGTGSGITSGSNIGKMHESIFRHQGPWPGDRVVVSGYFAGPGARIPDVPGRLLGTWSRRILENAYRGINLRVLQFLESGYSMPKIDIFGFSRGAAIANELAWLIFDRGFADKDYVHRPPAKSVHVRFLGLFDTVHSMELPGPNTSNEWHHRTIAPIIDSCAHAFARDENRGYFVPTILGNVRGNNMQISDMIFPGVHSDVGGFNGFNENIMKLTRSWIAQKAVEAGALYLKEHILSVAEEKDLVSHPEKLKPSLNDLEWVDINVLKVEGKRREMINRMWGKLAPEAKLLLQTAAKLSVVAPAMPVGALGVGLMPMKENLSQQPDKFHFPRVFPIAMEKWPGRMNGAK